MENRQIKQDQNNLQERTVNRPEAGNSLVSVIVALGIGLIVAQQVMKSSSRQMDMSLKSQTDYEVASIQRTVVEQLDCAQTLGITDTTVFPLTCSSFSSGLPLKRSDGTVINPDNKVGRWSVTASCDENELKIGISKAGRDSITKKLWSSLIAAKDAFRGSSDFCKNELGSPSSLNGLTCFTATRFGNTVEVPGSKAGFIEAYNEVAGSGENLWGLSCKAPFVRVGCHMDGPTSAGGGRDYDTDLRPHLNGCNSDDEEWDIGQRVNVTCCSISR